jgi:hypothetical protein
MELGDQLSQLSQQDQGAPMQQGPQGPPMQISPGMQQGAQNALGGPGVDTPQEQQAVQMLMQGAQLFRQAAETDPSVAPIVDKMLMDSYLQITKHYGFEQEGKLSLQQAQMQKNRMKAQAFDSPAGQAQGPPVSPMGM